MYLTAEQYATMMRPLNSTRVAKRSQGGKQLSYLEAWDVKAHLTRIFGFGNWDAEVTHTEYLGMHDYMGGSNKDKKMVESMWQVTLRLTIRTVDPDGDVHYTLYSEAAVGSATGSAEASGWGDLHDNAVKQAASDALKRCAINLGTQFGLSLYNDGSTSEIIKKTLVGGHEAQETPEQKAQREAREASLTKTVGAKQDTAVDDEAAAQLVTEQLGASPVPNPYQQEG